MRLLACSCARGVVPTTQRAMILTATQFATYDEVGLAALGPQG